jgi:uncharacterized membrane protein
MGTYFFLTVLYRVSALLTAIKIRTPLLIHINDALSITPYNLTIVKGSIMSWILYVHILAACAWIGGSIVLFGLGVFLKDKATQEAVYGAIGPFYGYFETVWLIILIATGFLLGEHYELFSLIGNNQSTLAYYVTVKMVLVIILSLATIIHLTIAFSTHQKTRSLRQKLLSRGGSLAIFILNLAILWVAMNIRTLL